jgi:hypothetical protein
MNVYIVVTSKNELEHLSERYLRNANKIIIVDEGEKSVRFKNSIRFYDLNIDFYGPYERESWFKERFGTSYKRYLSVIPERCHAENSFGFLVAWEEDADYIIELDDDVRPLDKYPPIRYHLKSLCTNNGITVHSKGKWYNTLDNLKLNNTNSLRLFPRGYPFDMDTRIESYTWIEKGGKCILNMGLWTAHPDLDALTILYHGGLTGRCFIKGIELEKEKIIVGEGTYFPICSMNTSFRRQIIPAFYQLYMKYLGIDRFDDIWSGVFFKKIADHLGDKVCLGAPLVYHNKRPRDVFSDLKVELEGIAINEQLWKIVDDIELNYKDYYNCYSELILGIEKILMVLKINFIKILLSYKYKK